MEYSIPFPIPHARHDRLTLSGFIVPVRDRRPFVLPGENQAGGASRPRAVHFVAPRAQLRGRSVRADHHSPKATQQTNGHVRLRVFVAAQRVRERQGTYWAFPKSRHTVCRLSACNYSYTLRKTDTFLSKSKYLAFVSTTVETANPHLEIQPGLDLLGAIDEKFIHVSDILVPTNDGAQGTYCISQILRIFAHTILTLFFYNLQTSVSSRKGTTPRRTSKPPWRTCSRCTRGSRARRSIYRKKKKWKRGDD
jgi:hypothetical protein